VKLALNVIIIIDGMFLPIQQ